MTSPYDILDRYPDIAPDDRLAIAMIFTAAGDRGTPPDELVRHACDLVEDPDRAVLFIAAMGAFASMFAQIIADETDRTLDDLLAESCHIANEANKDHP